MKCADFESRLQSLLDERRSPDEYPALIEHQQGCVVCRRMTEALMTAIDAIRHLPRPEPAKTLSQRVLEEVRTGADAPSTGTLVASGRQRSARMTWRSWSVVATAAAVVVVAVFAWQQLGTDRATDRVVVDNSSESTDRVAEEAPQAPPPVAVSKGDVEQTADEATTSEEPNEVADPGEVFLALVGLSPVTGAGRTANANAAGAANGLDNPMTEGLRQVGDSTAGALGRLLDAFPVPENPSS